MANCLCSLLVLQVLLVTKRGKFHTKTLHLAHNACEVSSHMTAEDIN